MGSTHDKRLARSHLVIADAATVGFEHPHGILLTLVKVGNAQSSEVKVGKRLVRTVKVGSHKTVEKAVVPVGELLFEDIGCAPEPINKALPDFLNLGICHLDSMSVPYFMVLVSPVTLSVTSLLLLMSGMVLCRACFKRLYYHSFQEYVLVLNYR